MSFINTFRFCLAEGDRLQFNRESNFDPSTLLSLIEIRPIEVFIIVDANGNYDTTVTMPKGLHVVHIPNADERAPYCINIEDFKFGRLVADIEKDGSSWLIRYCKKDDSIDTLKDMQLVVKTFKRQNDVKSSLLFCAVKEYVIHRGMNERVKDIVSDPFTVPTELLRLVDICDEPLPTRKLALDSQLKRVASIKKVIECYSEKTVSLKAKEELEFALSELDDYKSKIDMQLNEVAGTQDFDAILHQKMIVQLKQLLGTKKFETVFSKLYREAGREVGYEEIKPGIEVQETFYKALLDEIEAPLKPDAQQAQFILKLLNSKFNIHYFPNHCRFCGHDAVVTSTEVGKFFAVECTKCKNKLGRERLSTKKMLSISNWNKENPPEDNDVWLAFLGITPADEEVITKDLKRTTTVLMKMISHAKNNYSSGQIRKIDLANIQDCIDVISYVNSLYKAKLVQNVAQKII